MNEQGLTRRSFRAYTVIAISPTEMLNLTDLFTQETHYDQDAQAWDARKQLRLINCISFSDCNVFLPCWVLKGQHWLL